MGKRPSTDDRVARTAKASKVEDEYAPLSEILTGEPDLPEHCRKMLRSSVPHAMSTLPEERHAYQNQLIDVVMGICSSRESRQRAEVQTDESHIALLDGQKRQATSDLDAAKARASTKAEAKAVKAELMTESVNSVTEAKLAVAVEKEKEKANMDKKQEVIGQKTEYEETLVNLWDPLKSSTLNAVGHHKSKAIARVTAMIGTDNAPESLTSALALALKKKADKRSSFADKAVEFAEGMLKDHVTGLASRIGELEAQGVEVLNGVTASESTLKTAEEKLHVAQDESIVAENDWVCHESEAVLAKDAVDKLQTEEQDAEQALAGAKSVLVAVLELNAKVESLRDHTQPASQDDVQVEAPDEQVGHSSPATANSPVAEPANGAEIKED